LNWLDAIPTHKQTPSLWRLQAQVLTDQGRLDEALVALNRAARGTNEDRMMAQVLRAQIMQQQGQLDDAAELVAPYLEDEQLPATWRARALRIDASRHVYNSTYVDAKLRLQQALALSQQDTEVLDVARIYQNLGVVERLSGELLHAERYYRLANTYLQQLGMVAQSCITLNSLGMILLEQGRLEEAEQRLYEALELAHKHHDVRAQTLIYASLGDVAMGNGALAEAGTHYVTAYRLARQHGYTRLTNYALSHNIHSIRLRSAQGALIEVIDHLDAALASNQVEQAWLSGAQAGAYWALNLPGALERIDQALAVLPNEEHNDRAFLLLLRAQILFDQQQTDAAMETFACINDLARSIG
jgi:tetratricopeptide (TPR) repeat protein